MGKSKKKKSKVIETLELIEPVEPEEPLTKSLRLPRGPVDWSTLDTRAKTGFPGQKEDAPALTAALGPRLSDLQERLFAQGRVGDPEAKRILVVLQGMDTSGKGGVIRHAIGLVDPQGVKLKAFKAPTAEERKHPYLWRIEQALPEPGMIGIFDRSHYEDVLTVRVNELVSKAVWSRRYTQINRFEEKLAASGMTVIKCFLHISSDEQKERLAERLDKPDKHWKYNPGDVDERAKWDAYVEAYATLLEKCNTDVAPWYAIPSDRKWYRNWAVAQLLAEHLEDLKLEWPQADFDVEQEKERLAAT